MDDFILLHKTHRHRSFSTDTGARQSGIFAADCGYTSPEAIIKKVMHERKYPASVLYPLTRLGAKLYGHFDLEETSAPEALKQSGIPVFFVHGDDDRFVPWEMSRENYQASSAVIKRFLTITGAGHGISYIVDRKKYLTELFEFLDKIKKTEEREERQADQESRKARHV